MDARKFTRELESHFQFFKSEFSKVREFHLQDSAFERDVYPLEVKEQAVYLKRNNPAISNKAIIPIACTMLLMRFRRWNGFGKGRGKGLGGLGVK